jgi:hypothetical protein
MPKLNKVALNAYISFKLEEHLHGTRAASEWAREHHLTPQFISMLRNGKGTVGDSEEIFAEWLAGGSIDGLRSQANEWWEKQEKAPAGSGPQPFVVKDDRYPNFGVAATFAIQAGMSRAAIDAVRNMRLESSVDLPPLEWLEEIRFEDRRHKRIEPSKRKATAQAPAGVAPAAEDPRVAELRQKQEGRATTRKTAVKKKTK